MVAWARKVAPFVAVFVLLLSLALKARTVRADPPPVYREADSCAELAPGGGISWYELRIDDPESGTYSNGYLVIDLLVYRFENRDVVDWQANQLIDAVYVAGGPGGNLYQYNPPGPPVSEGTALHAPLNPSGRNYHSPEALLFCSTSPLHPTPTSTPTATATPTVPATPTPPSTPDTTATGVPTATAVPDETPTPAATSPPPASSFPVFLALAVTMNGPGAEEPNDSCGAAHPVAANRTLHFLADDQHDWFTFVLAAEASLSITVSNFTPLVGQIAAYRGESCSTTQLLQNYGFPGTTKTLHLGRQPAGRYYVYVSNDGEFNDAEPYQLLITAEEH